MGGEENERQMANNVMREIGIVMGTWYIDFLRRLPGNGARNPSCPIILGRPFFRTVCAIIDMKEGNIRFQFPFKRAWNTFQERK